MAVAGVHSDTPFSNGEAFIGKFSLMWPGGQSGLESFLSCENLSLCFGSTSCPLDGFRISPGYLYGKLGKDFAFLL